MFTLRFKYLPFVMWAFPLAFFAFQFILRLWPGLMMQPIMQQFSIDATHFGFMAALYYYGYAGMQIPAAILLDRFQARYIIFLFALICGLATLLFTYSTNWYLACFSRFLIGAGSAVGFLGVSKVISEWFSKDYYTKMVGFSFTIGLLGAIYGGKPISLLTETYYWKTIALILALVSLLLGFGALLILRSKTIKECDKNEASLKLKDFKTLLLSPTIWLLAIANLLMVGSLEGFSDVWGVPYLMSAYDLSKSDAAQLISFVFIGMLFGGPLLAFCSKLMGNYAVITLCGIGMALIFTLLLTTNDYHWNLFASLFFVIGLLCCYQVIVFATGADLVRPQYLGVTVAFLNCINMLGGSFFHSIIGHVMDFFWSGELSAEGIKRYSVTAYQSALLVIPLCAIIGAGMVTFLGLKLRKTSAPDYLSQQC